MKKLKELNVLVKTLVSVLLALLTIILMQTQAKAMSLGGLDDLETGTQSGDYFTPNMRQTYYSIHDKNGRPVFCSASNMELVSLQNTETVNGQYDNQIINYEPVEENIETEQSIAAAYMAYEYYKNNNGYNFGIDDNGNGIPVTEEHMRKMVQIAVWYSEIWSPNSDWLYQTASTVTMPTYRLATATKTDMARLTSNNGYVSNIDESKNNMPTWNTDIMLKSYYDDKIIERAEAWANFYYEILNKSGMKLNIQTSPIDQDDVEVEVDQNNRTYIQGRYKADIVDSNGNVLNDVYTKNIRFEDERTGTKYDETTQGNSYGSELGTTLGTLVYNEILGLNPGCDSFQFCKLTDQNALEAIVKFSNGETARYDVEIIDDSGHALAVDMPEFGKEYYFKVTIPSNETRQVESITYEFNLTYFTKLDGLSNLYKSTDTKLSVKDERLEQWTDTTVSESIWETNKTIQELKDENVITYSSYNDLKNISANTLDEKLKEYLLELIKNSTPHFNNGDGEIISADINSNFNTFIYYKSKKYETVQELEDKITDEEIDTIYDYEKYITTTTSGKDIYRTVYVYDGDEYSTRSRAESAAKKRAEEICENYVLNEGRGWNFEWGDRNPQISAEAYNLLQSTMQIVTPPTPQMDETTFTYISGKTPHDHEKDEMVIGGKVWVDVPATKEDKLNGIFKANDTDSQDYSYSGMLVELICDGRVIRTTTTDENGEYRFEKLNTLKKYIVRFTYNGQIYEDTYYKDDLSGGYSNAQDEDREGFNERFESIYSSPNSYDERGWNKAYGLDTKLMQDNGEYIPRGSRALTYRDAWEEFVEFATEEKEYDRAYDKLEDWLRDEGVGKEDRDGVVQYIKDCMITAETRKYPVYDKFVTENLEDPESQPDTVYKHGEEYNSLYTAKSDQSRNVDFGIYVRDTADLAIQKDVYKTTVRVNGKTQTYMYNKKDANIDEDGTWNVEVRAGDSLYNGEYRYTREIRKSEYLYDGEVYSEGGTSAKDLQVYITYRIIVRNQSQTYDTKVEEIVDYFDSSQYEFDGELNGNKYNLNEYNNYDKSGNVSSTYVNSYVGDRNGNKIGDLTVKTESSLGNNRKDTELTDYYTPIYLTGMVDYEQKDERISAGGGMTFVYLTFKVKTHTDETGMDGRVQMDVNTETGEVKGVGKRNLAEINGYSTYYKDGATIPNTLGSGDMQRDKSVSNDVAGLVDNDSIAGNLRAEDIDEDGDLITSEDPVDNRAEDDTDKAPNVRLVFPEGDEDERTFTGYVYEDERNQESDLAVVGNGKYDEGETKINGVTVQLVELIQDVDENGIFKGNYLGEYVWTAKKYENGNWVNTGSTEGNNSARYYSGQKGTVSPILSGPGATSVEGYGIDEDGEYGFKAVPSGDMFIRFIYGDTTQTTLTKADGEGAEVVSLISGDNVTVDNDKGFISKEGLNAKSYNGQDYKSTTYQAGVNQQAGEYNGIKGFVDYNAQNYNINTPNKKTSDYVNREISVVDGKDKNVMYYYNIGESSLHSGISDAKDVGNIRSNVNEYGRGISDIDGESDHQTLVNSRAEVLTAGLKVGTKQDAIEQVNMIKEQMNNTAMVSQTGVINVEIEYNRNKTENQGDKNEIGYLIEDIDLGLTERPVSQLKVNKEVSNLKITLADGSILFDTGSSVNNLSYKQHEGHSGNYENIPNMFSKAYRLTGVTMGKNTEKQPELITTYMDEELMYGARIELYYTISVTNIGEVDYLDNQFYYTGKTNNTAASNISTTAADTVVDYVSNNLQFLPTNSNNGDWGIRQVNELTGSDNSGKDIGQNIDLINSKYINTLGTYNVIVTTKTLGNEGIYPEKAEVGTSTLTTNMMLSSTLAPDTGNDSMVYNNLVEIVQTSNSQGRRMKYSVAGNQPMADQSLGTDAVTDEQEGIYTKADLVTPTEIDSDSSQQVLILPPTGANRNYAIWVITGIIAAILVGGAIILIKKKVLGKKKD